MDDWDELTEFYKAHENDLMVTLHAPMLRTAYEVQLMLLPGTLLKAFSGDSSALSAQLGGAMVLAYMLGQRASGIETVDEWLGAKEEEG